MLEITLAKVRGNTMKFSAQKHKKMEDHLSTLLDEIGKLEIQVDNSGEPMPNILEEI